MTWNYSTKCIFWWRTRTHIFRSSSGTILWWILSPNLIWKKWTRLFSWMRNHARSRDRKNTTWPVEVYSRNNSQVLHDRSSYNTSPNAFRYKNIYDTRGWDWHSGRRRYEPQMKGSIMYCSLLRPDLMYYDSQLNKVMSRPTTVHMGLPWKVLEYLHDTYDNVITYRTVGCDGFKEKDCSFFSFSDSDWPKGFLVVKDWKGLGDI